MNKRVLIVDDDEDIQALLQATLEAEDYDVSTADDGVEALKELDKARPDLILLDLMMPRMDGYAFTEELRNRGLQSSIPIIVLSADVSARQKVEQMGVESYVCKPFDILDLLNEVSSFMGHLAQESVSVENNQHTNQAI